MKINVNFLKFCIVNRRLFFPDMVYKLYTYCTVYCISVSLTVSEQIEIIVICIIGSKHYLRSTEVLSGNSLEKTQLRQTLDRSTEVCTHCL